MTKLTDEADEADEEADAVQTETERAAPLMRMEESQLLKAVSKMFGTALVKLFLQSNLTATAQFNYHSSTAASPRSLRSSTTPTYCRGGAGASTQYLCR